MRKLLFWGTVVSGVAAAYLMFRRGASIGSIAQQAVSNPVGTLVHELENAV